MKWSIVIALCISILGLFIGMGLPGALVLTIAEQVLALVSHNSEFKLSCIQGDRAWPAAIIATIIWPVFIPLAYWIVVVRLKINNKFGRWLFFAGILLLAAVGLALIMNTSI